MAVVKIDGTTIGAFASFQWALTAGVRPYMTEIETEVGAAKRIFAGSGGRPVNVQVGPRIFEQVYVTALMHGNEPGTRRIQLRDRRWLWERSEIVRRYNIRTLSGETRLIGEGRIENRKIDPDVRYQEWSLNNGRPWTFLDAMREVFRNELGINLNTSGLTNDRAIDFEDFSEKGTAADIIERLLSFARGYNLRLDDRGQVFLYDEHDGSEEAELLKERKVIRGSGWRTITDKRYLRPSRIRVLFTREIEVRFDYEPGVFSAERGREPRRMLNVIPVPVRELTLAQTSALPGAKVFQNTLITLRDYFATAELTTNLSENAPGVLTDDRMAEFWNKGETPGSHLRQLYTMFGGEVDQQWLIYINAAMSHWRRTFLVIKAWRDRIRSFKAERVAINSFENASGSRSRSPVYCDFTLYPNYFLASKVTRGNASPFYQIVTRGYDDRLDNAQQAPAPEISLRPGVPGLLRIFLSADPMINARYVIPGVPIGMLRIFDGNGGFFTGNLLVFEQQPLEPDWNLATIITCIQGAPNNNGQLHEVVVDPSQAESALGYELGESRGPEMTIIVDETPTTTARFFWNDDFASQIEEAFYTGGVSPPDSVFENKADVDALALGVAARVYEFFSDRVQGQFSTDLASPGEITGAIAAHSFQVSPDGVGRKTVSIPPLTTQTNPLQYVEASVRRKLQRLVEL